MSLWFIDAVLSELRDMAELCRLNRPFRRAEQSDSRVLEGESLIAAVDKSWPTSRKPARIVEFPQRGQR